MALFLLPSLAMPEHCPGFDCRVRFRSSGCKFELVFSLTFNFHLFLPVLVKYRPELVQRGGIWFHVLAEVSV